ncbi:MAG: hypothetical protein LUH49_14745 [Cloacibacillus porcorum]|uniref:hypothetical protein n=1 Tax=Cloacibacillus porcorum TaxID=1197717 RepID=UPI0023F410C5|nr:hypothetical protein [Cloacibacillus porcorum]MCD7878188.1 hypothetical protein [Cloacibacillus porcorum]
MYHRGAEHFFHYLIKIKDETLRHKCLEISQLPKEERGVALLGLGYDFSPKELDDVVCREFPNLSPSEKNILAPGDIRDIVMREWGNFM